ncbi:hypothetical protein, partial [Chryseobacterium sp. Marseille-Q3244]|uniref:hypothetical protein n=1 Tax=Chryseobacterium sp. Marseille-Q3244 TaxID=2758092 RepID=UPI0020255CE7
AGMLFSQSKLLASITISTNSQQYKKYNVTYKKDLQETGYRYLNLQMRLMCSVLPFRILRQEEINHHWSLS